MNCQEIQDSLGLALDQQLPPAQRNLFEAHLEHCPHCRQEWQHYQASWELLAALPELEPSPLFQARVWEKIRLDNPRPTWNFNPWRWLASAAMLAVLFLGWQVRPQGAFLPAPPPATPSGAIVPALDPQVAGAFHLFPSLDELTQEDSWEEPMELGDLSQDYLAFAQQALDETLESH